MQTFLKMWLVLALIVSMAITTSCTSSGDGGDGDSNADASGGGTTDTGTNADGSTNIVIPSRISIVDNSGNSASKAIRRFSNLMQSYNNPMDYNDSDTDYTKDPVEVYSLDPMVSELEVFDRLFQMLDLTGYKYIVGKGAAKVKFDEPEMNQGDGSTSGSDSYQSSKTEWIIQADYTDGSLPLVVKIWGTMESGDVDGIKFNNQIKLSIFEGVSELNPIGKFELLMSCYDDFGIYSGFTKIHGKYIDGKNDLKIYSADTVDFSQFGGGEWASDSGTETYSREAHIRQDRDNDSGDAWYKYSDSYGGDSIAKMAWNSEYAYSEVPWYECTMDSCGESTKSFAVSLTGTEDVVYRYGLYNYADGSRKYLKTGFPIESAEGHSGWASRWGVYVWDQSTGQDVTLTNGTIVTEVNYDGTTGDQYTINLIPGRLIRQAEVVMNLSDLDGVLLDYWDYDMTTYESINLKVAWDNTNSKWVIRKECSDIATSGMYECTDRNEDLDISESEFYSFYLTGQGQDGKSLSWMKGDDFVTAHEYQEIDSLTNNLTLYEYDFSECYTALWGGGTYSPTTYTVSASDLTLKSGGTAVTDDKWTLLETPLTLNSADDCFNSWDADVSYSWWSATEGQSWTYKTRLITADGTPFVFDAPLSFTYQNDDGVFEIEYYGFGELYVPWVPSDEADDFMGYQPATNLATGTLLPSSTSPEYVVKQLDIARKFNPTTDDVSDLETIVAGQSTNLAGSFKEVPTDPSINGTQPTATMTCVVDGKLVDADGNPVTDPSLALCQ